MVFLMEEVSEFSWNNVRRITKLDIGIAVLAFVICRHFIIGTKRKGPKFWPIVGMAPCLIVHYNRLYEWMTEILLQCGGSYRFVGPIFTCLNAYVTCNPQNVEYILREHFENFPKGEIFHGILQDLLGEGIFNVDQDEWRLQRKAASLEFHSPRSRKFLEETVERLVQEKLLPVLENATRNYMCIDLQDIFLRYTFDNLCLSALGVDPGCLSIDSHEVPFAKAFNTATEIITMRFLFPGLCWKFMRALKLGKERQLHEALKTVDEFALGVISSRKKELSLRYKRDDTDRHRRADLLSCFLQTESEGSQPCDDKFLRDVAINFILAGRDTSAVALSWFFWLLAQNPDVEGNILHELNEIIKSRQLSADKCHSGKEEPFTREELQKMNYLHAALSETLRLYPSVPLNFKQAAKHDRLPDGTNVKPREIILYSTYTMGRMESIWGKDCLSFKPERWLIDNKFVSQPTFRYAVFNAGPRLCLGKEMAYMQMKSAAAGILLNYKVSLKPGHVVTPRLSLVMLMKNGLQVLLRPRNPSA